MKKKMAREIRDRKQPYVDETKHSEDMEDSSLRSLPSDMNAVDAYKVSKMWVGE